MVDFLIPPSSEGDRGGDIRHLKEDLAAIIAPGLHLAFEDVARLDLSGLTVAGEQARRTVLVCGPGAFIVLKALAFDGRGENKDAYDLYYVLRNYGSGLEDVAECLRPLLNDPWATKALEVLRRDFTNAQMLGPRRTAQFLVGGSDDDIQRDVAGYVSELLETIGDRSRP